MTEYRPVSQLALDFHSFFDQYYPLVFRSLLARTGNRAEAEDLTQDTFFRASQSFQREGIQPSLPWLLTIASNVYKNWLRYHQSDKRVGLEQPINETEEVPVTSSEPLHQEKHLMVQQRIQVLEGAIATLPEQMRRCFTLFFLQEYKYEEIAILMGITVQTVKSQISRGRKKVLDSFQQVHN